MKEWTKEEMRAQGERVVKDFVNHCVQGDYAAARRALMHAVNTKVGARLESEKVKAAARMFD